MRRLKVGKVIVTAGATWAILLPLILIFLICGFFPAAIAALEWLAQFS